MIPSAKNKHQFYMEMAKLLQAGFDIRRAAGVLNNTRLPREQVALLKDLNEGLEAGDSIAGAFAKDTRAISELERSIITAGERGGKLAAAFHHLAEYFGLMASARQEVVKGMIYPLIVLHLGVLIGTIPLSITGEERTGGQIAGGFFGTLAVMYLVALVLFFAGRAVLKMAPESPLIDGMINRLPWIGKTRRNMAMSRFCKVYHSCLLAGISMRETVRVSADASQSGRIRRACDNLVAVANEGNALGPQFMAEDAFPQAFARSYLTGEEAGMLDTDMESWSRLFQERAESSMKTAAVMIPKVMYFFIMLFVAWKIIGFFTGYYSGLDTIGE